MAGTDYIAPASHMCRQRSMFLEKENYDLVQLGVTFVAVPLVTATMYSPK